MQFTLDNPALSYYNGTTIRSGKRGVILFRKGRKNMENMHNVNPNSLYNPSFEHDNCGIGAVFILPSTKR